LFAKTACGDFIPNIVVLAQLTVHGCDFRMKD